MPDEQRTSRSGHPQWWVGVVASLVLGAGLIVPGAASAASSLTATNAAGSSTVTSPWTAAATTLGPGSVVAPMIAGAPAVGDTLTAFTGAWTGDPTSYVVQWLRCDTSLSTCDAVGTPNQCTYTLSSADLGHDLLVGVYAINALGVSAFTLSNPAGPVLAAPTAAASGGPAPTTTATTTTTTGGVAVTLPTPATNPITISRAAPPQWVTVPSIAGMARVGSPLTASPGTLTAAAAFSYQWQRCAPGKACTDIAGATGARFTPTRALLGSQLRVVVSATTNSVTATNASAPTIALTGGPTAAAALARLGVRLHTVRTTNELIDTGLRATLHCQRACRVTVTLVAAGNPGNWAGTIGTASARLRANDTRTLTLRPARGLDHALAATAPMTLEVLIVVTEGATTRRATETITVAG